MQTVPSNTKYSKQGLSTGGFIDQALDAPVSANEMRYEATLITGGSGTWGCLTMTLNLVMHVFACGFSVAAGWVVAHHEGTEYNTFLSSWAFIMCVVSPFAVVLTVLYYGLVKKGLAFPIAGTVVTWLFLTVLIANINMAYYYAGKPADRKTEVDWIVPLALYLNTFVVASILHTPVSGLAWAGALDKQAKSTSY